ncbi:AT-hook motif nuclear-localized protein 1-like [Actinidia eriantha]|uniref:AT-hook motif nuclear-localized protein 1-like n=1 Tax=Actinidia eriantha TaxID=165200 RepID=UPI00258E3692|nr:AT-hook motif nuclear-localized protein 1-like [Actinidia eriantha]XP_057498828.1 AT-hook motif nuclear-localized protein 1-like [Actinidia eriantha]
MERQRRGRPRKYGPSGALARALSPMPILSSAPPPPMPISSSAPPPASAESSAAKQGVGQAIDLENNQWYNVGLRYAGDYHDLVPCSAEARLIPHVINIEQGEDITMKILSFHDQQHRALCVFSAIGLTSNVKLRQPGSSGVILTFKGIFQILALTGSFTRTEVGSSKGSRSGGLNVTLAGSDGRMIGGMLAGLLIAAGPVKVVVGSFKPNGLPNGLASGLPNGLQQQKRKKKKRVPKTTPIAISSASMFPNTVGNEHYRTPEQNNSVAPIPNLDSPLIRTANRASMGSTPDSQRATTDINTSLHGA